MSMSISIPNLEPQIRKLADFDRVSDKEIRLMQQVNAAEMVAGWRPVAAFKTGTYMASIHGEVRPVGPEIHAVASTSVRSNSGFAYPRALEESNRYHYRSTVRRGANTAGQVARMFKAQQPNRLKRAQATGDKIMAQMVVGHA